jgi:DNA-binding transcriptional MerR regulator
VSSRTYLSIGDVLTLLREEFPDVTISKIRFLESQGLVNPERSPSGYRKFFEPDVERLRWVLRQQREHFLPLKVIRDRLAAGDLGDVDVAAAVEPSAESVQRNGAGMAPRPAHVGVGANAGPAARALTRSGGGPPNSGRGRTEAQLAQADNEAMARILADASRRAALIPEGPSDRAALHVVPDPSSPTSDRAAAGVGAAGATTAAATDAPSSRPPGRASGPAASTHSKLVDPETLPARQGAPDGAGGRAPEPHPKGAAPTSRDIPARSGGYTESGAGKPAAPGRAGGKAAPAKGAVTASMVTGASLTVDELCAASGLSGEELAGLQSFGLIEPVLVAGMPTFDEDALTVANLAAAFRKFGIEPRHLRQYRNATDREIGLIEQVIIPLLRQRNPESRQRATEAADELGTLGQTMRATLLRAALRRHVGG